jgi:site-specific recombinase XerD
MTREAYTMDLRRFTGWCRDRSMSLFEVRRAGIEMFARDLEDKGRARAAVTRRPSTIAGFCKYAAEEVAHDLGPSSAVTLHEKRARLLARDCGPDRRSNAGSDEQIQPHDPGAPT